MLPNAVLGALREVDVVVEGNVGGAQRSSLENSRYSLRRSCSSDFSREATTGPVRPRSGQRALGEALGLDLAPAGVQPQEAPWPVTMSTPARASRPAPGRAGPPPASPSRSVPKARTGARRPTPGRRAPLVRGVDSSASTGVEAVGSPKGRAWPRRDRSSPAPQPPLR